MAIISRLLEDSSFDYYCLVDSAAQIELLGTFYSRHDQHLNVLVELGVPGGRTGVRDDEQLTAVLAALERWRGTLLLSGIEIYEGVLDDETLIRAFLDRALAVTRQLALENRFHRSPILLSGAGPVRVSVGFHTDADRRYGNRRPPFEPAGLNVAGRRTKALYLAQAPETMGA